jgi:hypothetical protein
MRRVASLLAPLALAARAFAADDSGCAIALARTDAGGVATYSAECRWPVAPRFVAAIIGDPKQIEAASTSLVESTKLADGRVLNVHSPGWPIDDRQSTLAIEKTPLPDGGLLLAYALAREQVPLGAGRVQARRDDGRWEIRSDGGGGTLLRYETTYDAAGGLPVSLVQRTVRRSVAESLAELRAAAEANARAERTRADGR